MIFSKQKRILSAFLSLTMIGTMVASVPFTASAATSKSPYVAFSVFENNTWKASKNGAAGQTGKKYKVSAIKAALKNAPKGASLNVSIYENKKWISNSKGKVEGSAVKKTKLYAEALKATLKGCSGYTLSYKVFEGKKWTAATKNGAIAGKTGKKLAIEAVNFTITKNKKPTPPPDQETPTVSSVSSVADVTVANGTASADAVAALAKAAPTVDETLSDGTTKTGVAVTWTAPATYVATTAGTYAFTGTLADVDGVDNSAAVTATANVVVAAVSASTAKSLTAISAKALQVTFDQAVPVATQSNVTFAVTRAGSTAPVTGFTTTWNTDGTQATLTSATNLTADTYTVNVSGSPVVASSVTTVVSAQAITTIKIVSPAAIKSSTVKGQATFTYQVLDQYGTDITSTVPDSAFTKSAIVGSTQANVVLTPSTGVGTITLPSAPAPATPSDFATTDTTAIVTLVHNATGKSVSATLNLAAAATVANITFGTPVYPTGKTRIEAGSNPAVSIPVTVTDQYGATIKDLTVLNGSLKLISSDNTNAALSFVADANGNPEINVNTLASPTTAEPVVITLLNSASGKTWSTTITVVKPAAANAIQLGDFSKTTLATGDTGITLNATITDQFGATLTADQMVANKSVIDAWLTNGSAGLGGLTVNNDRNSANYGKLVSGTIGAAGTYVLIANAPGGVVTKQYVVTAARTTTTVTAATNFNLIQGASNTGVKFGFVDQYGVALSTVTDNADLTWNVKLSKVSGDDGAVTLTAPSNSTAVTAGAEYTGLNEADIASLGVTSLATKTGIYNLTVTLLNKDGSNASVATTTINVVKNNTAGLTYSVETIPTLAGNTAYAAAAADAYAHAITVDAKDASGIAYSINPNDILSVSSSDNTVATVAKDSNGSYYVAGANIATASNATETATITVQLNTQDGIKTITQTVTVSKAAPATTTLKVVSAALASATTDISGTTSKLTYATSSNAVASQPIYVIAGDQYGVWTNATTGVNAYVNSTNYAPVDAFTVTGSTLSLNSSYVSGLGTTVAEGQDILVTLVSGSASIQIIVNIGK